MCVQSPSPALPSSSTPVQRARWQLEALDGGLGVHITTPDDDERSAYGGEAVHRHLAEWERGSHSEAHSFILVPVSGSHSTAPHAR
jgi:hypothetical protein